MPSKPPTPLLGFPWDSQFVTKDEVDAYFMGDEITCLLCGRQFKSLHNHLRILHDMQTDEYKELFGIPWRRGLISEELRNRQAITMKQQRKDGILPHAPSKEHIAYIQERSKHRRGHVTATKNAQKAHGLKMHGRTETWGRADYEEFLNRIATGRTVTEVGKDKDMPCRELFDGYKKEHPEFDKKFWEVWEALPFDVQVRGQKTSKRFKKEVVKLRDEGHSWPEIGRLMSVKTGTARGTWFRLRDKNELDHHRET